MSEASQSESVLARYYRRQAGIYDSSRWAFLFGRERLIQLVSNVSKPLCILEVGCGTGRNLKRLATAFPRAKLCGIDLSSHMLQRAEKSLKPYEGRVDLIQGEYGTQNLPTTKFDLIVFSYCLSMMNPGWQEAIESAWTDLNASGVVAAVDFYASPVDLFKRWMAINHVSMEAHLTTQLEFHFDRKIVEFNQAYGGLWQYFVFIGQRAPLSPLPHTATLHQQTKNTNLSPFACP